ncbi:ABC-2 type transport system ATP-binding protein [Microbacteriaceae bacterium SG_E_30_P1]|uniref:ABC-2 type transport system ATP-binding protein n=1 Tax=Antiquaquibacter oligotrophicus TaxID=2880260 RepID=A0ABT6KPB7_9MICO|nr:ABC transporter ATP-binding protein [Antiquaquibacter oligotrophicus]MDH6181851.1 ABC-2 type transport system ATP-binding protein [Antiquaquibacter oligotrophicus]UDF12472.1 ABC transporter ATP-binding protein [Antiquaquibacter oligotrophicus]
MTENNSIPSGGAALELRALRREFGDKVAVDDIDLVVPTGSFYGVVGPNGAGKTTALSMAVGLLRPSSGAAFVLGLDVWSDPVEAKRRLGVLPDGLALPERLTGGELLTYWGRFRGMPADVVAARAAELLRILELEEAESLGTLVGEYSTGMRKKIGLATALLHSPRVLVLDEPYEAVDPVSARVLTRILRRFTETGGSVIISSHVMALVEQLCDHVAIVADGKVIAQGTLDEVRGGRSLDDRFVELVGAPEVGEEELAWIGG